MRQLPLLLLVALGLPTAQAQLVLPTGDQGGLAQTQGQPLAEYPGAPYQSRNGDLWFGTVGEGLIRYDGESFVTYTVEDGLPGSSIRGFAEDDKGTIWIATTGGVSKFDGETFTTLTDYGDIDITRSFAPHGDHRDIWEMLFDRKGQLWIATTDGVFRYVDGAFVRFPMPVEGAKGRFEFGPRMVYHIYEDRAGDLWFCTDGAGAIRYDGETMLVYTNEAHGLCSDRVCTVLQDRRGDYWFGTSDGGVSRFDGKTFTTHLRSETHSIHTGWGRYMSILEDRSGNVWFGIATVGGGAYRYDGKSFERLSVEHGLGTGQVASIRLDRSGKIWIGTNAGVFRLDGERFTHVTR